MNFEVLSGHEPSQVVIAQFKHESDANLFLDVVRANYDDCPFEVRRITLAEKGV